MKRTHASSSDTEDDEPLMTNGYQYKVITKNDLCKLMVVSCEFCDAVFYNMYDMMIHNGKHIIIPLLRQELPQCHRCNSYFNSKGALEEHHLNKHLNITNEKDFPEIKKTIMIKEPCTVLTKEEFELNKEAQPNIFDSIVSKDVNELEDSDSSDIEILETLTRLPNSKDKLVNENDDSNSSDLEIVETFTRQPTKEKLPSNQSDKESNNAILKSLLMQPITLLTKEPLTTENERDKLLDRLVNQNPITLVNPLVVKDELIVNLSDESDATDIGNKPNLKEQNRLKDRILFEDDNEDCVMEPNGLDLTSLANSIDDILRGSLNSMKSNRIILGKYPTEEQDKSVHYDELIKPGFFKCKKCTQSFPNRYELIIHETSHMRYKRRTACLCRMCDWYVSSSPWGLRDHQNKYHPFKTSSNQQTYRCKICKLNYVSYNRHLRNYHQTYKCKDEECNAMFENYNEYKEHKSDHEKNKLEISMITPNRIVEYIKLMKVCELCSSLMHDKGANSYIHIGSESVLGDRIECEICKKKVSEVHVKKRITKRREYNCCQEKKKETNEDRLRRVRCRLMKLKMLNKY